MSIILAVRRCAFKLYFQLKIIQVFKLGISSQTNTTYIDEFALVSTLEVPEDRGFVEISQVGHVIALLELGRVDRNDGLRLGRLFLKLNIFIKIGLKVDFVHCHFVKNELLLVTFV